MEIPHSDNYGSDAELLKTGSEDVTLFTPVEIEIIKSAPDWYFNVLSEWSRKAQGPYKMDKWSPADLAQIEEENPRRFLMIKGIIEDVCTKEELASAIESKFKETGYTTDRAIELGRLYIEHKEYQSRQIDKGFEEADEKASRDRQIHDSIINAVK